PDHRPFDRPYLPAQGGSCHSGQLELVPPVFPHQAHNVVGALQLAPRTVFPTRGIVAWSALKGFYPQTNVNESVEILRTMHRSRRSVVGSGTPRRSSYRPQVPQIGVPRTLRGSRRTPK